MTDTKQEQLTYAELRTAFANYLRQATEEVERTPSDELDGLIDRVCDGVACFRRKSH